MIAISNNYPIFEADQVLSQKHLNKLIDYLEEQDRLSRTRLLGMGVVCGLEINKPNKTTIQISCGTAITSLGYLITLDNCEFTHYKETTISETFLHPDVEEQEYLNDIYEHSKIYEPFKNTFELLKNDSEDQDKEPLTSDFLDTKIVMLLLEVSLIDQKNCDTLDCADKGKRLEFKLRPLLVDKELIAEEIFSLDSCITNYFETIPVPKYNVPKTNLVTGNQVLNQFNSLITTIKQNVNKAVKAVHNHYQSEFNSLPNYGSLFQVINKINAVQTQNKNTVYIQYVWDWVCDIVATYEEISIFNTCNPTVCCPDKERFPFHVLLGSAEFSTSVIELDNDYQKYRTHFIKSGVFVANEENKKLELKSLLEKLIHQINHFDLNILEVRQKGIKITPSVLGKYSLSQKAIPYYYNNIASLNKKWSSKKTQESKNKEILSYHSKAYNTTNDFVSNPLRYDNEPYNFYRIEGHIGKNYIEGLTEIISQKEVNRLPFKVVALNALSFSKKEIAISKHIGDWQDLELDYDLAKTKVYNITEHVINWITANKTKLIENSLMTEIIINNLKDILTQSRDLLKDDLQEFLPEYEDFFEVFKELNDLFLLHRFCIQFASEINQKQLSDLAEDLIDHFDEINSLFLEDPFTVIVEEAHKRWKEEYKEMFLTKFLEKHPGINHKAGVPKGGTFIVVYIDSSIFKRKPFIRGKIPQLLLARINNYKKVFKYSEKQIKEITAINKLKSKSVVIKSEPTNKCKDEIIKVKGDLLESIKENIANDTPLAIREYLFGNIDHIFELGTRGDGDKNIPERIIIADFYLPYICCSNGNNINIMLPPNEDPVIVADFDGKDFDGKDFFTND